MIQGDQRGPAQGQGQSQSQSQNPAITREKIVRRHGDNRVIGLYGATTIHGTTYIGKAFDMYPEKK